MNQFLTKIQGRRALVLIFGFAIGVYHLCDPMTSFGQVTTNRSGPGHIPSTLQRPTVSPYLLLGRTDTGALPSYQAFVQPQFQVLRQQQAQWSAIQKVEQLQRNNQVPYRATGRGGKYMDTLHFYNQR